MTPAPVTEPVPRRTVRIVLLDDADRLLLFSVRNQDGSSRWFQPGGGLKPGESHERAAVRELREETGLTKVTLGPEIWRGRGWNTVRDGVTYNVRQRYLLARVSPAVNESVVRIDTSGFEALERATITGYRWWSVDELAMTTDVLRPTGLAELLSSLLTNGPPSVPLTVPG